MTYQFLPQFLHLENGDTNTILVGLSLKMNRLLNVKPLRLASVTRAVVIIIITVIIVIVAILVVD